MKTLAEFDFRKATQAIGYLARRDGGQIGNLKLIKLAYLADRYHLRRYGRPIFNDAYLAMQYGPVGSSVKDIAELSPTFLGRQERDYAAQLIEKGTEDHTVRSRGSEDMDVFSDSEEEALRFAYDQFGKLSTAALVAVTHRYPEWARHAAVLDQGTSGVSMSYQDFFDDPAQVKNDQFALSSEVLAASSEEFEELLTVARFWSSSALDRLHGFPEVNKPVSLPTLSRR
jgi:uncharacterized phage-associated protein